MIEPQRWQRISGAGGAEIFAVLQSASLFRANTYLVKTEEQIIVVDPGPCQGEQDLAFDVLRREWEALPRPIFVFLTHCHVDHAPDDLWARKLTALAPGWSLCIHEAGGRILAAGDRYLTQADILDMTVTPREADFALLAGPDVAGLSRRDILLPNGHRISAQTASLATRAGHFLMRQSIPIGRGAVFEVYGLPGHSPDSVGIGIGEFLMVGDLFHAANPLVAGVAGWNREALMSSLENADWLLEQGIVSCCLPGHGKPLKIETAMNMLREGLSETRGLGGLEQVNPDRIAYVSDCATDLLDELNDILTIMAGRLYRLTFYLDELEEPEAAKQCLDAIPVEKMDAILSAFNAFNEDYIKGRKTPLELALHAIWAIRRILAIFDVQKASRGVAPALLRRASRLLNDFMQIAKGLRIHEAQSRIELNGFIGRLLGDAKTPPYDTAMTDLADGDGAFLQALIERISHLPIFQDIVLDFKPAPGDGLHALVSEDRFADLFLGLLEDLVSVEVRAIHVAVEHDGLRPAIRLLVEGGPPEGPLRESKARAYRRALRPCGVEIAIEPPGSILLRLQT